jgi:hypothetical protein
MSCGLSHNFYILLNIQFSYQLFFYLQFYLFPYKNKINFYIDYKFKNLYKIYIFYQYITPSMICGLVFFIFNKVVNKK